MALIAFTGNVGSVELKFTAGGKAVCDVSVAENHRKKDPNGQWVDDGTTWRRVTFWDRLAEAVADKVQQGQRVIVTGDERNREYETRDGGTGRSLEVNGRDIGVLVMPLRDNQQSGSGFGAQSQSSDAWGGGWQ